MKSINLIVLTCIFAVVFNSCKKDELPINNNNAAKSEVALKIKNFIAKVESPERTEWSEVADEMIWNVEAALNYLLCEPWKKQIDSEFDSVFVEIPINGNIVKGSDIINLWNELKTWVTERGANSGFDYHFHLIDVDLKEVSLTTAKLGIYVQIAQTATEDVVETRSLIGFGFPAYGSTDWWWWGKNGGKCNGFTGSGDAAIKIRQRINAYGVAVPGPGYSFTDVSMAFFNYSTHPVGATYPSNNNGSYLTFWQRNTLPDFNLCLSPTEMNYYTNGTHIVATTPNSQGGPRPNDKVFAGLWSWQGENWPNNSDAHTFWHEGHGAYAKIVYTGGGQGN